MPEVITLYLAGRFDQAGRLARQGASANGPQRAAFTQLAENIPRFAALWQRIQAAHFGNAVRPQMQEAMRLDRQIARNPQYSSQLRPAIVNSFLADAQRTRNQPTTSCPYVQQALAVDPGSAPARQMAAQCENVAQGMMREAASAPPERALSIYRQVTLMVPRSSPSAQQATQRLAAAPRIRPRDEDE
jgi:hypothetical protein